MISALKLVTVQRGHDPRDIDLLVTGGAGPMHAAALGRELGVARTIIPPLPGLFSAFGMLATAPRVDISRSLLAAADAAGLRTAEGIFAALEAAAARALPGGEPQFLRTVEMRYQGQEHTVPVAWPQGRLTLEELLDAFGEAHARAYTFRLDGVAVELVAYLVTATQPAPVMALPAIVVPGAGAARAARPVLTEAGMISAAVLHREALEAGFVQDGPALVEEATATTLLLAGQRLTVDGSGCLVIAEHAQ